MKNLTDFRKTVETGVDPGLTAFAHEFTTPCKLVRKSGIYHLCL